MYMQIFIFFNKIVLNLVLNLVWQYVLNLVFSLRRRDRPARVNVNATHINKAVFKNPNTRVPIKFTAVLNLPQLDLNLDPDLNFDLEVLNLVPRYPDTRVYTKFSIRVFELLVPGYCIQVFENSFFWHGLSRVAFTLTRARQFCCASWLHPILKIACRIDDLFLHFQGFAYDMLF